MRSATPERAPTGLRASRPAERGRRISCARSPGTCKRRSQRRWTVETLVTSRNHANGCRPPIAAPRSTVAATTLRSRSRARVLEREPDAEPHLALVWLRARDLRVAAKRIHGAVGIEAHAGDVGARIVE